jgi:hypothetical protein
LQSVGYESTRHHGYGIVEFPIGQRLSADLQGWTLGEPLRRLGDQFVQQ